MTARIPPNSAHNIKESLLKGPLIAELSASSPIFKFYRMGIIDDQSMLHSPHLQCNQKETNHAVLIVGWGVEEEFDREYLIIKNSFGTDWGENGYARISTSLSENLNGGSCNVLSSLWTHE